MQSLYFVQKYFFSDDRAVYVFFFVKHRNQINEPQQSDGMHRKSKLMIIR